MADAWFRQDMPPAGGYKPIEFKKIPLRPFWNGKLAFAAFIGVTAVGNYIYLLDMRRKRRLQVQEFDSNNAIEPLLAAERDREYLKQLMRNREAERELMKDVPGWNVGTYFGEPLYRTAPANMYVEGAWDEYFAHSTRWDKTKSRLFFYHTL